MSSVLVTKYPAGGVGLPKSVVRKLLRSLGLYDALRTARFSVSKPDWWVREQAHRQFFRRLVPRGGLVFDVGANVGAMSQLFLDLGARVVAAEPQPQCVQTIAEILGGHRRLTLVPKAIGAAEGTTTMWVSTASAISSCSPEWLEAVKSNNRFGQHTWNEGVTVPVTTLDCLVREYGRPDFCKVDVEGFELEVLKGLSAPVPALSLEFTPGLRATTLRCIERLADLGFRRLNYARHRTDAMALPADVTPSEALAIFRDLPEKTAGDLYAFQ